VAPAFVLFPAAPPEGAGELLVVDPVFALAGFGVGVCAVTHGAVPFGTVWFGGCAGGTPVGLGAVCVGAGVCAFGGGTGSVSGPAALVVIGVGGPIVVVCGVAVEFGVAGFAAGIVVCVGGGAGAVGVVLAAGGAGCDVGGGVADGGAAARVRCAAVQVANVRRRNNAKMRVVMKAPVRTHVFSATAFF